MYLYSRQGGVIQSLTDKKANKELAIMDSNKSLAKDTYMYKVWNSRIWPGTLCLLFVYAFFMFPYVVSVIVNKATAILAVPIMIFFTWFAVSKIINQCLIFKTNIRCLSLLEPASLRRLESLYRQEMDPHKIGIFIEEGMAVYNGFVLWENIKSVEFSKKFWSRYQKSDYFYVKVKAELTIFETKKIKIKIHPKYCHELYGNRDFSGDIEEAIQKMCRYKRGIFVSNDYNFRDV